MPVQAHLPSLKNASDCFDLVAVWSRSHQSVESLDLGNKVQRLVGEDHNADFKLEYRVALFDIVCYLSVGDVNEFQRLWFVGRQHLNSLTLILTRWRCMLLLMMRRMIMIDDGDDHDDYDSEI